MRASLNTLPISVASVGLLMARKISESAKRLLAHLAFIRFFSNMRPLVDREMAELRKALIALVLFTTVQPLVDCQVRGVSIQNIGSIPRIYVVSRYEFA